MWQNKIDIIYTEHCSEYLLTYMTITTITFREDFYLIAYGSLEGQFEN